MSISSFRCNKPGDTRDWRPTMLGKPLLIARLVILAASSEFAPNGHSVKTDFPASRAATVMS